MKNIIIASFLLSSTAFAQNLDVNGLKSLMTTRKVTLEAVNAGMSKKMTTTGTVKDENGQPCAYKLVSTQSILKIDGAKMLVLARERFSPANTPACRAAGYTASTDDSMLYYETTPTLATELADLDSSASSIRSISRAGELVTITVSADQDLLTLTYDMTKSAFKNMIETRSSVHKVVTENMADIDPKSADLKEVFFCDNNDGDNSECTLGDWSDILW